jgi:hypothetical protein
MSQTVYSNGKGDYSLEQLPDFYKADPDDVSKTVEVYTFGSKRDADFFLKGLEASRRLDKDMIATPVAALEHGRFGVVVTSSDAEKSLDQFNF